MPLREGRLSCHARCNLLPSFNPRPYERGDNIEVVDGHTILVSIHAPTRGATDWPMMIERFLQFQSTPLREGRHNALRRQEVLCSFNPRPYERGDPKQKVISAQYLMFQSTPLREGRLFPCKSRQSSYMFQSTPLREGRPWHGSQLGGSPLFQSTPLREGRHCGAMVLYRLKEFQSTPLREGRLGKKL